MTLVCLVLSRKICSCATDKYAFTVSHTFPLSLPHLLPTQVITSTSLLKTLLLSFLYYSLDRDEDFTARQMWQGSNPSIRALSSPNSLTNISRAVAKTLTTSSPTSLGLRSSSYVLQSRCLPSSRRNFSFSKSALIEYFPPPKDAPNIKVTPPAWHHPVYTEKQMHDIIVAHRQAQTWSDWVALGMVRLLRWGTDIATGYKHPKLGDKEATAEKKDFVMNERKWMIRFIFLETVAGVPGMVGGMLRHLRSLRRMQRDNGW